MFKKNHFSTLTILWIGAFIDWVSYGFIYPIFAVALFQKQPLFAAHSSLLVRGVLLGVVLAASPLGQFFSSSFLGALSDKKGRKPIFQITYFIIFIGYALCAVGIYFSSLLWIIFGRVVTGCGAGNIAVINSAISDISRPQDKAKNFALMGMAGGIGFTVGPFLGGVLSNFGFFVPFVAAGAVSLITVFIFRLFFKETLSSSTPTIKSPLLEIAHAKMIKKLIFFLISFFVFCLGWSFYWEFIPVTWVKNYSLNTKGVGNFYAFGSAIYCICSSLIIKPIVKRFKPVTILIVALGLLTLCFATLIHAPLTYFWPGIAIQQFCVALIFPLGTSIVSNAVSKQHQGKALGSFQAMQSLGFAATPFLGGIFLSLNSTIPLFIGCASMALSCLILTIRRKI